MKNVYKSGKSHKKKKSFVQVAQTLDWLNFGDILQDKW